MTFAPEQHGYVLSPARSVPLDSMGPTIEVLTDVVDDPSAPALLRGSVPPGHVIPMHAHGDPETFFVISGEFEALVVDDRGPRWIPLAPGQVFHVPPGARHALRNSGSQANEALIVSTPRMAEFFTAIGVDEDSAAAGDPSPAARLEQLLRESAERAYWNATPEENAAVGIELPPPA